MLAISIRIEIALFINLNTKILLDSGKSNKKEYLTILFKTHNIPYIPKKGCIENYGLCFYQVTKTS